jgi:hypothetical protein
LLSHPRMTNAGAGAQDGSAARSGSHSSIGWARGTEPRGGEGNDVGLTQSIGWIVGSR